MLAQHGLGGKKEIQSRRGPKKKWPVLERMKTRPGPSLMKENWLETGLRTGLDQSHLKSSSQTQGFLMSRSGAYASRGGSHVHSFCSK